MKDIVMKLNLPQGAKNFLCKTKIKEDDFEDLNIKFFNKEHGFLYDVVEWTKINDHTLNNLNEKFVAEFLGELEKFRAYYVIADNLGSGNLIAIQESTGEVYELEHEVIEEVAASFVNSSFAQMYESMKYFKEVKSKIIEFREQENIKEIEMLLEKAKKDLVSIDNKVVINDDEYNCQFWNGMIESYREWCLD